MLSSAEFSIQPAEGRMSVGRLRGAQRQRRAKSSHKDSSVDFALFVIARLLSESRTASGERCWSASRLGAREVPESWHAAQFCL